jgi:hypothetical protein
MLGLLAAPSAAGACLAGAAVAGFFARRPLRTAMTETDAARRLEAVPPSGSLRVSGEYSKVT